MKMLKNKILTLLLFTFAFFMMHDYLTLELHQDTKYEISHKKYDKSDIQCKIHDTIHNFFNVTLQETSFIETKLLNPPPSSIIFRLSSNINIVLQKPPLI